MRCFLRRCRLVVVGSVVVVVVVVVVVLSLVCGLVACLVCCSIPLPFVCSVSSISFCPCFLCSSLFLGCRWGCVRVLLLSVLCAMPSAFLFLVCVVLTVSNQLQSLNVLSSFVMFLSCSSLFVFCLCADLNVASSSMCVRCGSLCVFLMLSSVVADSLWYFEIVSHCLNGVMFRRYCSSHDRICFSMLLVMLQVSLLNKALIADELSHACIFFAAGPGFRRLRKLAQKHFSVCVNLCFMLVFVLPSVSSISHKVCVFLHLEWLQ